MKPTPRLRSVLVPVQRAAGLLAAALAFFPLVAVAQAPAGGPVPIDDPAVQAIDEFISAQKVDKSKADWKLHLNKPPRQRFDPKRTYLWKLDTNKGPLTIRLMPDVAPMHVTSTIYLTRLGFYDDLGFHRVIKDFMAQGGDPRGNGTGGPGYQYDGEFKPGVSHDRPGLLSMANAGPGTDGSQFFITFVPTQFLDGKHTLFGEVVDGKPTLGRLEDAGADPRSPVDSPREKLVIRQATIEVQ
jgi:cyclophilin family peptidyl-prolyl cis-trans isomerase